MLSSPLRLESFLGSGGICTVYRSSYCHSPCAVKVLNKKHKLLKQSLYHESEVLQTLDHPNIVKIYQGSTKGSLLNMDGDKIRAHYMVTELVEKGELFEYVLTRRLTEDEARHYAKQMVDALSYLYNSKGLVHGDLKSENMLLDHDYKLKLIDFGCAYADGVGQAVYNGTKKYMAPEVHGRLPYDPQKADIFSLGVTLHTLVTGIFPCIVSCVQGDMLYRLIYEGRCKEFWNLICKNVVSEEFRTLVEHMLHPNMYARPTIEQVKTSSWLCKPTSASEEIAAQMEERLLFRT